MAPAWSSCQLICCSDAAAAFAEVDGGELPLTEKRWLAVGVRGHIHKHVASSLLF